MNSRIRVLSAALVSMAAQGADLNLDISGSPLEIPQGAAPNIVVVMDDSGSMDWEIMTSGYDNNGLFAYNQPNFSVGDTGNEIRHKAFTTGGGVCTVSSSASDTSTGFGGYQYGVEFGSNLFTDSDKDCRTADELAWRFRNSDYNPLYYNPNRRYQPWPGRSSYITDSFPDGVPYADLVAVFKSENPLVADYLLGFDNPTNPTEWLDLSVHDSNYTTAGRKVSDKPINGVAKDELADGFSYFTWTDDGDGLFEGYFDAAANNTFVGDDTVVEVRVNSLTPELQENFQNWFNFYRSREFSVKGSLHAVLDDMITARIGYTTLNSTAQNFEVATMNPSPLAVGGNKQLLLANIDATQPNGGTPLRTALQGVGEYFSVSTTTSNRFGVGANPYLPASTGGICQQNYALLFTDGYWNGGVPSLTPANQDADDGTNKFDGWWFADTYSNTLADVAMKYYKNDLKADYADDVPITADDLARSNNAFDVDQKTMHQHMKTYTVAFGLNWIGDFVPSTTSIWPDPEASQDGKLFDLFHAAYNGRGDFYVANDYQTLASRLRDGFSKILAEQSGAAGVSFNSQELKTGTYIFRAFYNPATFDGDLVAIEFDENGVPLVDTPVWSASEQLENVIADGERLIVSFDPDANMGVPFDYDTGLNATQKGYFQTLTPGALPVNYGDADAEYADERVAFLHGDQSEEGTRFDAGELRERAGLLGDFANSTPRYVGIPQGVKRDSEPYPTSIGNLYSEFKSTYLDRDQLVYAGANDGMLHAFDAVSGRERFAYVPNVVMDDLYEFTLPGYIHEMSVDGSPGINDIFIDDGRTDELHWRSVLMGGLRAGGKGYYALDITDPSTFNVTDMPANVLWEFTSGNDDRLGFSFSTPNMVMSNVTTPCGLNFDGTPCTTQRWISLFGNGYNQANTAGESALFALFMDRGGDTSWDKTALASNYTNDDWIVMQTGTGRYTEGGNTYPNGLGIPRAIDVDGNGTADYVYAGDLVGNLYRFDISSGDPANWAMKQILFKAQYEVSSGVFSRQPITVQPIVTLNEDYGGYIVIASTGSWMTTQDVASTTVQSIYGIWDPNPANIGTLVVPTELVEQSFSNEAVPLLGYTYRTLTSLPVAYDKSPTGSVKIRVMGWKVDFDICVAGGTTGCAAEYPGERAIRNLLVKEGVLFGASILPSSNAYCSDSPGGYLFSINAQTGGLVQARPAFDLNADGEFDVLDVNDANGDGAIDDNEVPAAIRIEEGLPSDIAVIDGGANEGSKVCYQTSTGELVCTNANVDTKFPEGRLSWKELAD